MKKLTITLAGLLILFLGHCMSGTQSIRKGQMYSPDSGLFSVPSPVGFGGRYQETDNSVAFYDDMLAFYRIDFGLLHPKKLSVLNRHNIQEQLKIFSTIEFLEPLENNVPGSSLIHEEYIQNGRDTLLLLVCFIPQGSTYVINGARQDVERGLLFFRRGDHMFILQTQYTPNLFSPDQEVPRDQKIEQVRNKLLGFRSTMQVNL